MTSFFEIKVSAATRAEEKENEIWLRAEPCAVELTVVHLLRSTPGLN